MSLETESPLVTRLSLSFRLEDQETSLFSSSYLSKTVYPPKSASVQELDSSHKKELPVTPVVTP